MVASESLVYVFLGRDIIGPDGLSRKDQTLKKIKEGSLTKDTEQFNLDILYAQDSDLEGLQERMLCLPVKAKRRVIVIKDAGRLKADAKDFLLGYLKKQNKQLVLVLDINDYSPKDEFVRSLRRHAKVQVFNEERHPDAFALSRFIDSKRTPEALRMLNQLLENGEKPELILGGLRYSWENSITNPADLKRKLRLLLNCDIAVKTGKLKPGFALERLLVRLCCPAKPFG